MAGVADIPDKAVTTETVQAGKRDTAVVPLGVAQLAASLPPWEGVARCVQQTPGSRGACAQALGHTSLPRDEPEAPSHTCSPPITPRCFWPSHLHLCCPAGSVLPCSSSRPRAQVPAPVSPPCPCPLTTQQVCVGLGETKTLREEEAVGSLVLMPTRAHRGRAGMGPGTRIFASSQVVLRKEGSLWTLPGTAGDGLASSNPLVLENDEQGMEEAGMCPGSHRGPVHCGQATLPSLPSSPSPPSLTSSCLPPPPAAPCTLPGSHHLHTWHLAFPGALPRQSLHWAGSLHTPSTTAVPAPLKVCSLHLGTALSNVTSSKKSSPGACTPPSRCGRSLPKIPVAL